MVETKKRACCDRCGHKVEFWASEETVLPYGWARQKVDGTSEHDDLCPRCCPD